LKTDRKSFSTCNPANRQSLRDSTTVNLRQSRMFDLEVFEHFALGIDYDNAMFLSGENPVHQIHAALTSQLLALGYSLVRFSVFAFVVALPCHPSS
jgi:hypothetical protein